MITTRLAVAVIALALVAMSPCRADTNSPPKPLPQRAIDFVATNAAFWTQSPKEVEIATRPAFFEWTSASHECSRSAYPKLTFMGRPVCEALIWFDTNKVREVDLSLYNRGDAGNIPQRDFESLLNGMVTNLNDLTSVRPVSRDIRGAGQLPKSLTIWTTPTLVFTLEWSTTTQESRFRAEYIRLRIEPPPKRAALVGTPQTVGGLGKDKRQIEKTPKGDVYLKDVPMVDQGAKGYCAVAATERVLRYFGTTVDQHQLAEAANTREGTSPDALKTALLRISRSLRIKLTEIESFEAKDFLQLVDEYNAAAKRKHVVGIMLDYSQPIDISDVFAIMDPAIFKQLRTRNPASIGRFHDKVVQNVNKRIPVLWGVMLGLVPEPDIPQARGGHIRLIIGYNDKTREILYSDTWGAGHELKRMALDNAYAITLSMFTIQPR